MKFSVTLFGLLLVFFAFGLPGPSLAHLAGGEDKPIDGYVVDFGYDPEQPRAHEQTLLAFHLRNAETLESADYTHVWVRVVHDGQILSAVNVVQDDAGTNYLYTFPEGGEYTLDVEFRHDEDVLAVTEFILTVIGEEIAATQDVPTRSPLIVVASVLVGVAIGWGLTYTIGRKKRTT
jgi:hypothetical protein